MKLLKYHSFVLYHDDMIHCLLPSLKEPYDSTGFLQVSWKLGAYEVWKNTVVYGNNATQIQLFVNHSFQFLPSRSGPLMW